MKNNYIISPSASDGKVITADDLNEIRDILSPATNITVGVSGGIDSMVLVDILHRHKSAIGKDFSVLHVDHQISSQSGEWARFVYNWCNIRDIPCNIVKVDITQFGNNQENAARQARYHAFASQNADMLVLAHHANDQCETFFLKLFRGSGLKGLRCMNKSSPSWFDEKVSLARPLLDWSKDKINEYADYYSVPNIEDQSNLNLRYDRNWIRHVLWPMITKRNEIADINVTRSIALINEAWELTQELAQIDIIHCKNSDGSLDWYKVSKMSSVRLKNMVLHLLDQNGVTGFSTHYIEDFVRALINSDIDSRSELRVRGFVMRKVGKKLVYMRT